jgi:hypothetical protein
MKQVVALLLASAQAINIKLTPLAGHIPITPICVNVRKDTGIEEPCDTAGNSAWDPDAPLEDPIDLGWNNGFEALYWWSPTKCGADGCPTSGKPDFVSVSDGINYTSPAEF